MASNLPPGTMAYTGENQFITTDVEVDNYSKVDFTNLNTSSVEDAFNFKDNDHVTWININGLNNVIDIETLGLHYKLHRLTLEDIVNTGQRPKLDEFDNYIFVILKMLSVKNGDEIHYEHLSLILEEDYVLTFQGLEGFLFQSKDADDRTPGQIQ